MVFDGFRNVFSLAVCFCLLLFCSPSFMLSRFPRILPKNRQAAAHFLCRSNWDSPGFFFVSKKSMLVFFLFLSFSFLPTVKDFRWRGQGARSRGRRNFSSSFSPSQNPWLFLVFLPLCSLWKCNAISPGTTINRILPEWIHTPHRYIRRIVID